jgi:hypothetical protein
MNSMNRRGFLGSVLSVLALPWVARSAHVDICPVVGGDDVGLKPGSASMPCVVTSTSCSGNGNGFTITDASWYDVEKGSYVRLTPTMQIASGFHPVVWTLRGV